MAHRTVESVSTQGAPITVRTKHTYQTNNTLREFRKSAVALCNALYQDRP